MFSQNKVWFSHLRAVSNPDPIVLKFTGDVTDSKYDMGEDEETGYQYRMRWFEARGDDPDAGRYLVIENEAMEKVVEEIPTGQYVKLQASVGDDGRSLAWKPVEGGSRRSYAAKSFEEGSYAAPTVFEAYRAAHDVAGRLVPDGELSLFEAESLRQKHAATMFIQWQKTGFDVPLAPTPETEDEEVVTGMPDDDLPF